MSISSSIGPDARGTSRRSLLTVGAWAAPALLLTAATPAASASSAMSTLAFKGLGVDFESDQYPFYTVDIQLRLDGTWGGDYKPVTAVSVTLEFAPATAPFVFDVKSYGTGWSDPVLSDNIVTLTWAGQAIHAGTSSNETSPVHFKVKGTSAVHLTSFTATAVSADANAVVVSNQAVTGF